MNFTYHIPTKIFFGPGSLNQLSQIQLPGKKGLIVLSAGSSMRKHGYLDRLVQLVHSNGAETVVFDKILPNPIRQHVMQGAEIARAEKCDFIIGLGGGSSIDSAKSIAVMAKNPATIGITSEAAAGKDSRYPTECCRSLPLRQLQGRVRKPTRGRLLLMKNVMKKSASVYRKHSRVFPSSIPS